jgi:hypothetical protein
VKQPIISPLLEAMPLIHDAMLKAVKPEIGFLYRFGISENAENPAFFPFVVHIFIYSQKLSGEYMVNPLFSVKNWFFPCSTLRNWLKNDDISLKHLAG